MHSRENKTPCTGKLEKYGETNSVALSVPCSKSNLSDCRRESNTDYCPSYLRALLCSLCTCSTILFFCAGCNRIPIDTAWHRVLK